MGRAAFRRFLDLQAGKLGKSSHTLRRWIGDSRVLERAVPNEAARHALLSVTKNGEGIISAIGGRLSARFAAAIQLYPGPPRGTPAEDCRDWAQEVVSVADHYVSVEDAPNYWQVQTAKAKFSEVFRRALSEGPQRILRQGKDGVVMIAEEQYNQLVGKSHQPTSLVKFFRQSPLVGVDLDLERDRTAARDIDL